MRTVLQPTQTANGGACIHATTVSARKTHNVHIAQWTAQWTNLPHCHSRIVSLAKTANACTPMGQAMSP